MPAARVQIKINPVLSNGPLVPPTRPPRRPTRPASILRLRLRPQADLNLSVA